MDSKWRGPVPALSCPSRSIHRRTFPLSLLRTKGLTRFFFSFFFILFLLSLLIEQSSSFLFFSPFISLIFPPMRYGEHLPLSSFPRIRDQRDALASFLPSTESIFSPVVDLLSALFPLFNLAYARAAVSLSPLFFSPQSITFSFGTFPQARLTVRCVFSPFFLLKLGPLPPGALAVRGSFSPFNQRELIKCSEEKVLVLPRFFHFPA